MKNENKPTRIDNVKWALYRAITPTPERIQKTKWVIYGAAALGTVLMFAAEPPNQPKIPLRAGD